MNGRTGEPVAWWPGGPVNRRLVEGWLLVRGKGGELEDWSGIRDRVIEVERKRGRTSPPDKIFDRVLLFDEIEDVEAEIGASLPDEYAAFLAEVGSGGPGPEIELTTLCQAEGRWAWVWQTGSVPEVPDTSGPFMEDDEWFNHQIDTLRAAGHEPGERNERTGYLAAYHKAFGEDTGDHRLGEDRFRGAIQISDNGCGMTSWLILVGPHRGELRFRHCAYDPPLEPLLDANGEPHTFYTWYMHWLEQQEAAVGLRP